MANREYFHWEKLRYRPPPKGMTVEQAWLFVHLSRVGQRQPLPLLDERGHGFSYWLPDPAAEILHEVDRWGGSVLATSEETALAMGAMRDRIVVSSLMEEAIATSQIEGAVTTRQVAKEMLRSNRKPKNRSEQMVVNSYRTISLLRDRLKEPLTLDFLLEIQESMTRDTLDDPEAAGRFRVDGEEVHVVDSRVNEVVHTPPPVKLLEGRVEKLLAFANEQQAGGPFVHPLVRAAILHFWLAYEHPFVDGNGRTARALLYWFMLKSGYWLFEFLTISRVIAAAPTPYYRSFLYSEQDGNDLTYSVTYQLKVVRRALGQLREYLAAKQREQASMAIALRRFSGINHRQRGVMREALQDPSRVFTFASHMTTNDVVHMTARNDLIELAELGLLDEARAGRQRVFHAARDLTARLSSQEPPEKGPPTKRGKNRRR